MHEPLSTETKTQLLLLQHRHMKLRMRTLKPNHITKKRLQRQLMH